MKICLFLFLFLFLCCAFACSSSPAWANVSLAEGKVFDVAAAINTARTMVDRQGNAVFYSPERSRYAVLLVRGDTARNGLWLEVVTGQLAEFAEVRAEIVTRLFSSGLGGPNGQAGVSGGPALTQPGWNAPKWLDEDHVAILWQNETGTNQIVEVDLRDGAHRFLTHSRSDIVDFLVGPNRRIIFDRRIRQSSAASEKLRRSGFAVQSPDALSLLAGQFDGTSAIDLDRCERGVIVAPGTEPIAPLPDTITNCQVSYLAFGTPPTSLASPDGAYFLVPAQVDQAPAAWNNYRNSNFRRDLLTHRKTPQALLSVLIQKLMIVESSNGETRPLWAAPFYLGLWTKVLWSDESNAVVIGPTFTPDAEPGSLGASGEAFVEVDLANGRFTMIPVPANLTSRISSIAWAGESILAATSATGKVFEFAKKDGRWTQRPWQQGANRPPQEAKQLRVEIRETDNIAPVLYVVEADGKPRRLMELNPTLSPYALGEVEFLHWRDEKNKPWTGRFYFPVDFQQGRRYPLVIQTHGYASAGTFSLYGQGGVEGVGLGPGYSVYLAQLLAVRGIAVLQLGGADPDPTRASSPNQEERIASNLAGIDAAVAMLVARGLIDQARVGIMGHSATGRYVEQALVDARTRFAAAIISDYADLNYFQAGLYGWPETDRPAPFGKGLRDWLNHSPAFAVERIRTPVQILLSSSARGNATMLWGWEMFSRLRRMEKPVEYYIAPMIERGSHQLQNPGQLLAVQQRALDWWLFWLKEKEDSSPAKVEQYRSWRQLREQRDEMLDRPRPPRLNWAARPVERGHVDF